MLVCMEGGDACVYRGVKMHGCIAVPPIVLICQYFY